MSVFAAELRLVHRVLSDRDGPDWLPRLVRRADFEPYGIPALPRITVELPHDVSADVICTPDQAPPDARPDFQLVDFSLAGLSNVLLAEPVPVSNTRATFELGFGWLPDADLPPMLQATGTVKLWQACCADDDCRERETHEGLGTFVARLGGTRAVGELELSGPGDAPVLTLTTIGFDTDPARLALDVEITSIRDPDERAAWSRYANAIFRTADARRDVIAAIGRVLAGPEMRARLSEAATALLRALLKTGR
ncbi:MAG TPA: hypothetical protein VGM88_10985 [Kofleriaceae bacterium]|jgi:hypothetical protein